MANFEFSLRDRHALKWHLNGIRINDRVEGRLFDRVWAKLRLDDVASKADTDPSVISATPSPVPFELTDDERDKLIDWLATPQMGAMRRLLSEIDRKLIKSRDGDADAQK